MDKFLKLHNYNLTHLTIKQTLDAYNEFARGNNMPIYRSIDLKRALLDYGYVVKVQRMGADNKAARVYEHSLDKPVELVLRCSVCGHQHTHKLS